MSIQMYSKLMPEGALTLFAVCDHDAYRDFASQALLKTSQSRSRREYLFTNESY